MTTHEFQEDFEGPDVSQDGTSTERRPDAISLDYLTAFSFGPVAVQDPSEGFVDYAWRCRVDGNDVLLARENAASDDWGTESVLFTVDDGLAGIDEVDFSFTQNGDPVVVTERGTGTDGAPELWIYFFNSLEEEFVFTNFGSGRSPRTILDLPRLLSESDVLVFYVSEDNDAIAYREQGDRYNDENLTSVTGVEGTYIEELARNVENRLQVAYVEHDDEEGQYELDHLVSALYPFSTTPEAIRTTHEVMSAAVTEVLITAFNQDPEAIQAMHEVMSVTVHPILDWAILDFEDPEDFPGDVVAFVEPEAIQPTHEVLSVVVNSILHWVIMSEEDPGDFEGTVLGFVDEEAIQPTHEVIAATIAEVLIEAFDQDPEAIQPTHEVTSVSVTAV